MANPFSGLNLQLSKQKKSIRRLPDFNFEEVIRKTQSSTPKDARDRVILLLRHKYHLRPSEIAALNIGHVDLSNGVIELPEHRKNPHIFLCEEDLIHFRQCDGNAQVICRVQSCIYYFAPLDSVIPF